MVQLYSWGDELTYPKAARHSVPAYGRNSCAEMVLFPIVRTIARNDLDKFPHYAAARRLAAAPSTEEVRSAPVRRDSRPVAGPAMDRPAVRSHRVRGMFYKPAAASREVPGCSGPLPVARRALRRAFHELGVAGHEP